MSTYKSVIFAKLGGTILVYKTNKTTRSLMNQGLDLCYFNFFKELSEVTYNILVRGNVTLVTRITSPDGAEFYEIADLSGRFTFLASTNMETVSDIYSDISAALERHFKSE